MGTEMNVEAERAADLVEFEKWKGYPLPEFNGDGNFDKDWLHREWVAFRAGRRRAAQPADVGAGELPPIEFDVEMQRTYIPLPGGWEIQTKGNGSTFRIAHVPSRQRWQVLDDRLHEPLEAMARDMRNAIAALPLSSERHVTDNFGEFACLNPIGQDKVQAER